MVKFLYRLAVFPSIMLMIIIGMHAVAIWNMQEEVNAVYKIDASTEVLFLGSSQVGCSIDEDEERVYRLRKLWVSDTITPSCLMRLKELERRGQLNSLKMVVVPFNLLSVVSQTKRGYLWGWYQELPVSWRYLDMLPYSRIEFVWYILSNLRFPFHMHLSDTPPEREGLASRPESYRRKVLSSFQQTAQITVVRGSSPEWESRLFDAYREMNEICKRNGIRLVVYKAPLLSQFEHNLNETAQRQVAIYEERLLDLGITYIKPQIELGEKDFFDNVHLVKTGAEIFTAELFHQIELLAASKSSDLSIL